MPNRNTYSTIPSGQRWNDPTTAQERLGSLLRGASYPSGVTDPNGEHSLNLLPRTAQPQRVALPAAPTRNGRAEARNSLVASGFGALLGALAGGGSGAMAGFSGAGNGAMQGADNAHANRMQAWQSQAQSVADENQRKQAEWEDANARRMEDNENRTLGYHLRRQEQLDAEAKTRYQTDQTQRTDEINAAKATGRIQARAGIVQRALELDPKDRGAYWQAMGVEGLREAGIEFTQDAYGRIRVPGIAQESGTVMGNLPLFSDEQLKKFRQGRRNA